MTERSYFGTDGIRGVANRYPMQADVALKAAQAAGMYFKQRFAAKKALIAKDTRLSCYMFEAAMTAGFVSVGVDVFKADVLPTPGVSALTRSLRIDIGVMISASHNPFNDNGVKFFDRNGQKLSDDDERRIEALMRSPEQIQLAEAEGFGRVYHLENARGRYIEYAKQVMPRSMSLRGKKIALDCANGAGYHNAPDLFYELGAETVVTGAKPDGVNINRDCGSTHPQALARLTVEQGADIGVALDGDGDRLAVCDAQGRLYDGDYIVAAVSDYLHRNGRLTGGGAVTTSMSNMALDDFMQERGLHLARTEVGDRYVAERMRAGGYNIGGEQSGHIILGDYGSTGDGLTTAVQLLAIMQEEGRTAEQLLNCFSPYPQIQRNVPYPPGKAPKPEHLREITESAAAPFNGKARFVVRRSGTEPVIRILAEGKDEAALTKATETIAESIVRAAAG